MKKRTPQPAKRSYFFGPGFRDIGKAIRDSWRQQTGTAYRYYQKSIDSGGILTLTGIMNFFCALSVVLFGTIFFGAISLVILSIFTVMYALVYVGFLLVWGLDRFYLLRKRIFTACPVDKAKFLIPTYLCPNCRAHHTNLTPGVYGILRRTCNCGQKLPTVFFNGRKKLTAICPSCLENGITTYLNSQESRPLCVPVVGGRSVGKTAYITAFTREFTGMVVPQHGMEAAYYDKQSQDTYDMIVRDFDSGATRMTARPQDRSTPSSTAVSFFVRHKKLKPERLFHIYDIAGEVFTDNHENEVQKQYEYCQGIIFMVDPFSIPEVKAKYDRLLSPEDRAGIGSADLNGVIDVFLNKLREVTGLSERDLSRVPLAVVIGKIDSAGLRDEFSEDQVANARFAFSAEPVDRADAMDYLCREFLRKHGMQSFINTIDLRFKTNRYFACSAIGHTRDKGQYRPQGVMEPMGWICQQADRALADLWVDYKYSSTPALRQRKEGADR